VAADLPVEYRRALLHKTAKLDLGAGKKREEGWITLDSAEVVEPDILCDLEGGFIPLEDETCQEIRTWHTLEHIHNLMGVLNECWRVLTLGGSLEIRVPVWPSADVFIDPTHVRFFTLGTFKYFAKRDEKYEEYGRAYGYKPWEIIDGPHRWSDGDFAEGAVRMRPVKE
tara:strand:- start:3735 stop:4241 length:507 start_codon:yes stop_codon:yes gene_type:complete